MRGVNRTNYILKSFVCRSTVEELFNRWASEDPCKQGCKGAGWGMGLHHQLQKQNTRKKKKKNCKMYILNSTYKMAISVWSTQLRGITQPVS